MPGVPHLLLIGRDHVALEAWRRGLAVAGVPVAGVMGPVEAPLRLRATRPSMLALIEPWDVEEAHETIGRCRAAGAAGLPAILVLPPSSPWLHAPPPPDLSPVRTLDASMATAGDLVRAARLLSGDHASALAIHAGLLTLDPTERVIEGPGGDAFLTPSETTLLTVLLEQPREVVRAEDIARALWGMPLGDPHSRAAIRTHLHTLRRKLDSVGARGAVRSIAGVGYRFQTEVAQTRKRAG